VTGFCLSILPASHISLPVRLSARIKMTKKFQIYGLWPHELAFLGLLAAAFYYSDAQFRGGGSWPVLLFGAAVAAAVPVLAFRCREEWRLLPNKIFFFALAAAWVALFVFLGNSTFGYKDSASIFSWMFDIYNSPLADEQHALLIPFIVLILFWWKRSELVAQPAGLWPAAIGLVASGLLLHLAGYLIQQPRLSVLAFLVGLYGLTGLAWGKHWLKSSFFPFFLFAFSMPVGELAGPITFPLRLMVSWIVAVIAHLGLSPDLIREGTQLFDAQHTFGYEVAAACSGIRSLVALIALTTIYGFVNFKTPWKRAVMVLCAVPLAVLGNVLRLCFTIGVAEMFGQRAGKAVETDFGFITFAAALAGVFLIARALEKSELKTDLENKTATA
jgi:exosortase